MITIQYCSTRCEHYTSLHSNNTNEELNQSVIFTPGATKTKAKWNYRSTFSIKQLRPNCSVWRTPAEKQKLVRQKQTQSRYLRTFPPIPQEMGVAVGLHNTNFPASKQRQKKTCLNIPNSTYVIQKQFYFLGHAMRWMWSISASIVFGISRTV